ncbi:hypothetical protein IAU60_004363 [Kwoniella sp. DSM 27419]
MSHVPIGRELTSITDQLNCDVSAGSSFTVSVLLAKIAQGGKMRMESELNAIEGRRVRAGGGTSWSALDESPRPERQRQWLAVMTTHAMAADSVIWPGGALPKTLAAIDEAATRIVKNLSDTIAGAMGQAGSSSESPEADHDCVVLYWTTMIESPESWGVGEAREYRTIEGKGLKGATRRHPHYTLDLVIKRQT